MACSLDGDMDKIEKGWSIAMRCSRDRPKRVYELDEDELAQACSQGRLILETVCLFVHAYVKPCQYRLPVEFWRILHAEYGIVVYPSALTEDMDVLCRGADEKSYTEVYSAHCHAGRILQPSSPAVMSHAIPLRTAACIPEVMMKEKRSCV